MSISKELSILLKKVQDTTSKNDKIAILRENQTQQLIHLLLMNWDRNLEWNIPIGNPPYITSDEYTNDELFHQLPNMYIFQKGLHPNQINIKQSNRENRFIEMLGFLSADDAKLLLAVRNRELTKLYPTITHSLVNEAFPGLLPELGEFVEVIKNREKLVKDAKIAKAKQKSTTPSNLTGVLKDSISMSALPQNEEGKTILQVNENNFSETVSEEEIDGLLQQYGIKHKDIILPPVEINDEDDEEGKEVITKPIVKPTTKKPASKSKPKSKTKAKAPSKKK